MDIEGHSDNLADSLPAASIIIPGSESPLSRSFKPTRRTRVSVACQRCKHRKQKCDGSQPSCGPCIRLKVSCHYVMPANPKPAQAKIYVKALEDRVAELETLLRNGGDSTASRDHWTGSSELPDKVDSQDLDFQPLLNAVRDLSLDVAGSYVGGASTITLGRALGIALAGRPQLSLRAMSSEDPNLGLATSYDTHSNYFGSSDFCHLSQISQDAADTLVHAYLKHMCTNFPIIFSFEIHDMHKRRHELNDVYEESILSLVYGLGIHFLEKTTESRLDTKLSLDPEQFYLAALEERDNILRLRDTRALTYLMLLGQYCYRMPREPGAWTYFELSMKMCVELGLHRQKKSSKVCLKSERNKRLFWICYWHERDIAIATGRPPSICDHDIDVELPLDVDEDTQDLDVLWKATKQDRSLPPNPPTSMSTLNHLFRLKKIESAIQHTIYRVDRVKSSQSIYAETDKFLDTLYAWKRVIPQKQNHSAMTENRVYVSYDSYMASYYKTLRILLQPRLYEKNVQDTYMEHCAEACRGVCETYKRLHTKLPVSFTSLSLQSVFLAGLTLVYCMWIDTPSSKSFKNHGALTDCSIMLYVMAERWPVGRKYRDLFELVKTSVLEAIEDGYHIPRNAVPSLKNGMQMSLQQLQGETEVESVVDDLEQMIGDMTGGAISGWHDEADFSWTGNEAPDMFLVEDDSPIMS